MRACVRAGVCVCVCVNKINYSYKNISAVDYNRAPHVKSFTCVMDSEINSPSKA